MIDLRPIGVGLVATVLALVAITAFAAIGSSALRHLETEDPAWLPSAIVIGAAATSALLAIFTRVGFVKAGAAGVTLLGGIVIYLQRAELIRAARSAVLPLKAIADWRARAFAISLATISWVYAIAPPRDADSMRYHLAHLRQIISDGRWETIPDFHYAMPFAWTLDFLPFELARLPQAGQVVNLLLLALICLTFLRIARAGGQARWGGMLIALFASHPFIVRTFTTATADGYALFVVFVCGLLLLRSDRMSRVEATLLGFVAWVGIAARYHLLVWGAITTVLFLWMVRSKTNDRTLVTRFFAGAAVAILLASPFYIANLTAFGNPVWPLLVSRDAADVSYASAMARGYSAALVGGLSPPVILDQIIYLVRPTSEFPIALATLLACIYGAVKGARLVRLVALGGLLFAAFWLEAWPGLYPRLVLPALAIALIVALELRRSKNNSSLTIATIAIAWMAIAGMTAATVYAGIDFARYAVTGNARELHRYTWFYDVYDYVNRNTPRRSRFLVVVYSGHSYYLDRQYRRADPWLSAVVDWRLVRTGAQLDSVLSAGRIDGLIYQFRDWRRYPGGGEMMTAVSDAISSGYLSTDTLFHTELYTRRVSRRYEPATVGLFSRRQGAARQVSR